MVKKYFSNPVFLSALICAFFFYSNLLNIKEINNLKSLIPENQITLVSGILVSSPSKTANGKNYAALMQVKECKNKINIKSGAQGQIQVFIPSELVEAYFPGKLYSKTNGKAYIYESGAYYTFTGDFHKGYFFVKNCQNMYWPKGFFSALDKKRALLRLEFKRLMYSWGNAGGFFMALISGSREYTEEKIKDNFRKAGLSHILALSGMHLSLFSGLGVFIGTKLGRKKATYFLRIFILIIFVWFAGLSPSLLRAFICTSLMIIASLSGIPDVDMVYVLSSAFLIQSILSPTDIFNVAFILSYGALIGILLFSDFFKRFFVKLLPSYFAQNLSASCSAQIITGPVSLKIFGSFAPIGIIASCIVSPLITIYIYTGLILFILSLLIPHISNASGNFMNFMYIIVKYIVTIFSQSPRIEI